MIRHILEARAEFIHSFLEGLKAINKYFSDFWPLPTIVFNYFYFNHLLYLFDFLFRKYKGQNILYFYQTLWHTKQCWTREGIHWINSLFPLLMMFYNFERMRPNSCKVKLKRKSNMLLYTHMAEKNLICFFLLLHAIIRSMNIPPFF